MIRMELLLKEKETKKKRLEKYQQILTGKGDEQHEQHGSGEGVRRGRNTADKEHLPDEYQNVKCEVTQQQKNNGLIQTGIIFNIPGRELAPIIYMEPFYDQARSGEPWTKFG